LLDPEGVHLAALYRLGDFRSRRVLELGCGDGRLTVGIARDAEHVLAFDPDAAAVERARSSLPSSYANGSPIASPQGRRSMSSRTRSISPSSPAHSDESVPRTSWTF
jgi:ribosomal protein L11 methylase PrmA